MAKVSIVKWSQKLIFVDRTPFFGPTPDFEIALKTAIFKIFGYVRNGTSVHKNPFLRPLYNRYFCHITIVKWPRIIQNSSKKCIFWDIFILGRFFIKFPVVTLKTYHNWKEKSYRGSRDSFGNGMTRGTTWEGVEYLVVTKVKNKHSLTAIVPTVGPWSLQNPKYTFVSGIKLTAIPRCHRLYWILFEQNKEELIIPHCTGTSSPRFWQ